MWADELSRYDAGVEFVLHNAGGSAQIDHRAERKERKQKKKGAKLNS